MLHSDLLPDKQAALGASTLPHLLSHQSALNFIQVVLWHLARSQPWSAQLVTYWPSSPSPSSSLFPSPLLAMSLCSASSSNTSPNFSLPASPANARKSWSGEFYVCAYVFYVWGMINNAWCFHFRASACREADPPFLYDETNLHIFRLRGIDFVTFRTVQWPHQSHFAP